MSSTKTTKEISQELNVNIRTVQRILKSTAKCDNKIMSPVKTTKRHKPKVSSKSKSVADEIQKAKEVLWNKCSASHLEMIITHLELRKSELEAS